MLGDIINIRSEYFHTAKSIVEILIQQPFWNNKFVIGLSGESGSGKSVTAVCLQQELAASNKKALILHLDDYFKLPPQTNHENRLKTLENVGPHEVRLSLLQSHIDAFQSGSLEILKPQVNYKLNQILAETVVLNGYDCMIVEGTYSLLLENFNFRIFMDRTYLETKQQRVDRGRDENSAFIEEVLSKEHLLIRPLKKLAHLVVNKTYQPELITTENG